MEINKEDIGKVLHNILKNVDGEESVFEKMETELQIAEIWFFSNIVFSESELQGDQQLRMAKDIIILEAFRNAVPSLDLVLTPNGFGVVSNQTIAPASKERVKALIESLLHKRDLAINALWCSMRFNTEFEKTKTGKFLAASLFQDLTLSVKLGEVSQAYKTFVEQRYFIIAEEYLIARSIISFPLMDALRVAVLTYNLSPEQSALCVLIREHLINCIKGIKDMPKLKDAAVTLIKETPALFEVWKNTPTAELYEDHHYENDKKKGGVWL